jgi:hypothetical protein
VETAVGLDVSVCHARRIEGCAREAVAVEQNQTAGGVRTMSEFADAGICYGLRDGKRSAFFAVRRENSLVMQKIGGHFGHHDFHDSFAVTGAGDTACFGVSVTAATDQWGIADASGKFATSAASRSTCDKISFTVDGNRANGALLVPHMMFCCV